MAFEFVFKLSRWPITGVKSLVKKKNAPAWLENALQTTLRCRSFLNNRDVFLWKGCCRADGCVATSSFWDIDKVYCPIRRNWVLHTDRFPGDNLAILDFCLIRRWILILKLWLTKTLPEQQLNIVADQQILALCNWDSFMVWHFPIFGIFKLCRMKTKCW